MSYYYQKLERDLLSVLGGVGSLGSSEAHEIQTYVDAGEYGLCLETICAVLKQKQRPVSVETYLNIVALGESMDVDSTWWLGLEVQ